MPTIFALSSGALPAAVAVFRLSGSRSLPVLQEITGRTRWSPRELRYAKIWTREKQLLDTAMAVYLPGPSTFTGEETVEISVHGSRAVASALADRLAAIEGVRQAKRGEFVKRAFYNGKLDLGAVRGLRRLIESETDRQRQLSYGQMRGGEAIRRIRDRLTEAVMRSFLLMDFGEHVETSVEEIHDIVAPLVPEVESLAKCSRGAELVHRGLSVVLVGRPNSGKSSLLNALAQRDVAIVSTHAGTTRDSLDARITVCGVPMTLTDTAGLRDSTDELEREGMRRARAKIRDADMIVLVIDSSTADEASQIAEMLENVNDHCERSVPIMVVRNKSDLSPKRTLSMEHSGIDKVVKTCALSQQGIAPLLAALESSVSEMCPSDDDSGPCLADHHLLQEVHDLLVSCCSSRDAAQLCGRLEQSLSLLGQMAGDTASEALLDSLFQQFCIGK